MSIDTLDFARLAMGVISTTKEEAERRKAPLTGQACGVDMSNIVVVAIS